MIADYSWKQVVLKPMNEGGEAVIDYALPNMTVLKPLWGFGAGSQFQKKGNLEGEVEDGE